MYARVVREGVVRPNDPIVVAAPLDDAAQRHLLAQRLESAERHSSLAVWRAAADAGHDLAIVDDGDLAIVAAPGLAGPVFNQGLGFADLPHLVDRARAHFAAIAPSAGSGPMRHPDQTRSSIRPRQTFAPPRRPTRGVGGVNRRGWSLRELLARARSARGRRS